MQLGATQTHRMGVAEQQHAAPSRLQQREQLVQQRQLACSLHRSCCRVLSVLWRLKLRQQVRVVAHLHYTAGLLSCGI